MQQMDLNPGIQKKIEKKIDNFLARIYQYWQAI